MLNKIKYAYMKDQTWMYRRNYPRDVSLLLGARALKQSLRTGDPKVARARVAEVNVGFEATVSNVRQGILEAPRVAQSETEVTGSDRHCIGSTQDALRRLRDTLGLHQGDLRKVAFRNLQTAPDIPEIGELATLYLRKRAGELRPGGFKSVRYSVGLFSSKYGELPISSIDRKAGREFLSLLPELSTVIGKSHSTRGLGMDALIAFSKGRRDKICVRTQKRIWSQVNHFLDWTVYEGHLEQNPFKTVLLDRKVKPAPYAVPTDTEVLRLLQIEEQPFKDVLIFCLLTGMRAGEASGLLREDLIQKGNLGTFAHVRPNAIRELKTDASERQVPLHSELVTRLDYLPDRGPLFPGLTVSKVTKTFARLRDELSLERPQLVFHSTRKWFITQCERTGVPEHFTASLVGHKSARSENKLTYGIYSAGISDEQKRSIVDQIRLPRRCSG